MKLTEIEARDLLEIIHAHHHKASTIFYSQIAPMGRYNRFPEGQIADAVLDRIVYDSYLIEIQYIDKEHDTCVWAVPPTEYPKVKIASFAYIQE